MGAPLAVNSQGAWETPLGQVPVDSDLAESLKSRFSPLTEDRLAHQTEHALEVQIPFLQALVPGFQFVPITVGTSQLETLERLGEAIAESLQRLQEPAMVIASSDMNHYESDSKTRLKDGKAIERVLALDPGGLYEVVQRERITMCGYAPAVAMLTATKALGATRAELVKYATSGDVSGEKDWVVGYAGIAVR
jgi:AmmeMemoRadiSam system protein B